MDKAIIVKIGGSTLGSNDTSLEDVVKLQKQGKRVVIVHGGGKLITDWLARQGVPAQFVQGERVTDAPTLEVVVAVLAGLVNKDIVATINGMGGEAVGISGVDGALIEGKIRDPKMGYVGALVKVNTALLEALLKAGFVPVVAPVGFNAVDKSADVPRTLNFNADTIAGEIAVALNTDKLIFLTDVTGIADKSGKLLSRLSPNEAEALIASGVASGGMIPKIRACLKAVCNTSATCIIDGRQPHALLKEIEGASSGTVIKRLFMNNIGRDKVRTMEKDVDVKALRTALGLTQVEMAFKLNVDERTIQKWEAKTLQIHAVNRRALERLQRKAEKKLQTGS